MNYIEYLQTDGYCWFDTGIIPDLNTKIELGITPLDRSSMPSSQRDWGCIIGAQNTDDANSTFQIRNYSTNNRFSVRVGNGDANAGPNYTVGTKYDLSLNKNKFQYGPNVYTVLNSTSMDTCNYTIYISAVNNGETGSNWSNHRATPNVFYYVRVWKDDVLAGEFLPANDNGNFGFYDTVSSTFKRNLGTGTPIAGPSLLSISATASKLVLKSSGETINITVECANNWEATADDSWLAFSETSGSGNATITATAPSYTGNTDRETILTFTDTDTGDETTLTIKQKKLSNGQPVYLGGIEISEMFLGTIPITEAYLGDINVFIG